MLLGFLTESWHIQTNGMFAASCIGVCFLVVLLEALRRLGQDYDAHMLAVFQQRAEQVKHQYTHLPPAGPQDCCGTLAADLPPMYAAQTYLTFRPSPVQQSIRAVIHTATFGIGYIIMLLAMYFNGYIIISIFLGAGLGKFLCDWRSFRIPISGLGLSEEPAQEKRNEKLTFCCDWGDVRRRSKL